MNFLKLAGVVTLTLTMAACGSSSSTGGAVVPPAPALPASSPVTSLDVTVDLTQGSAGVAGWKPTGEPFYLTTYDGQSSRNLLGQTTLGADGHARLTLPSDAAVTPFLVLRGPTREGLSSDFCSVSDFSVEPALFGLAIASFVLKTGASKSGYMFVDASTVNSERDQTLVYADRDLRLKYKKFCTVGTDEYDEVVDESLTRGWNILTSSASTSTFNGAFVRTFKETASSSTNGTLSMALISTPFESDAPVP